MTYKFYIDLPHSGEVDITSRVAYGASIKERFAEELDVGNITISYWDEDQAINVLNRVKIEEYDDSGTLQKTTNMLVANDELEPITKYPPIQYRHNLTLIELTHKLDYYILNALTFTQPLIDTRDASFDVSVVINWDDGLEPDYVIPVGGQHNIFRIDWPKSFPFKTRHTLPVTFEPIGESNVQHFDDESLENPKFVDTPITVNRKWEAMVEFVKYDFDGVESVSTIKEWFDFSNNPLEITDAQDSGIYRVKLKFNTKFDETEVNDAIQPEITKEYTFEFKGEKRKKYSMYDVIKRIRDVYPIEKQSRHASTRLFNISPELATQLDKIQAPQLFMSKMTVRESLNVAFKYVNAISRLVQEGTDRILIADFFNKRTTDFLFRYEDIYALSSEQDNTEYSSTNRTFMSNVIGSAGTDTPSVREMGTDGYKGMRSETLHLTPDTAELKLHYNIYRVLKVTARVNVLFEYVRGMQSSEPIEEWKELDLDLTPYIVEKSIYDIANPEIAVFGAYGALNDLFRSYFRDRKDDLAYYQYGNNRIFLGTPVGDYFTQTNLQRIITSAVSEKLHYYQGTPKYEYDDARYINGDVSTVEDRIRAKDGSDINFGGFRWLNINKIPAPEEIGLNVEYIAIENNVHEANKEDTTIINKYTEGINNTNESIINFERASVGNYGIAQRLGVPTIRYGKIGKDEDIEPIGAVNQNREIVVEKEREFYRDHVLSSLEVSRDFNRLAKFIGVDRAYRPYEVPQNRQTLERKDIYSEYIEYSASEGLPSPIYANNTFITNKSMETIINTLLNFETREASTINQALFRTDGLLEKYPDQELASGEYERHSILMPVISMSGKHTLSFEMSFRSNIEAGYRIVINKGLINIDDDDNPYGAWGQLIPYGNEEGEFNLLHFTLLSNYDQSLENNSTYVGSTKNLPLVKSIENASNTYFSDQNNNKMVQSGNGVDMNDALVISKDKGEIYGLIYQMSFVPRDNTALEDVIIGKEFFNENFLTNGYQDLDLYFHTHKTDDFYSTFADNDVHEYTDRYPVTSKCTFEFSGGRPIGISCNLDAGTTHWSIGTGDGKVLLGVNSGTKDTVIFEPRNKRTSIKYDW